MVSVRKSGKVYEYWFEIALTNIGEISYEVLEGLNYRAARLAQIPDEQYREMFRKYASSKTKTPQEAEMLLDRIVERKKSITKKWIYWSKICIKNLVAKWKELMNICLLTILHKKTLL